MDQGGAIRWTKGGGTRWTKGRGRHMDHKPAPNNTKKWNATPTTSSSKVFFHVTMAGEHY